MPQLSLSISLERIRLSLGESMQGKTMIERLCTPIGSNANTVSQLVFSHT
jgi:hypothetical protein